MNYFIFLLALICSSFSLSVSAADIPSDYQGTQQLNALKCVDETTQTCINDSCLTSENIDCQSNCKKMAEDKCRQQSNE